MELETLEKAINLKKDISKLEKDIEHLKKIKGMVKVYIRSCSMFSIDLYQEEREHILEYLIENKNRQIEEFKLEIKKL